MLVEIQDLWQRSVRIGWAGIGTLVEVVEGKTAEEEEEEPAAGAQQGLARVVAAGCGFFHCAFLVILVHHVLGSLLHAAVAAAGIGGPVRFHVERR